MQTNTVRLTGYAYKPTERTTASGRIITRFGMKVYCGKDADGNKKYDFVNVKLFGQLPPNAKELDVNGHLVVESWEKDGIKHKDVIIQAESVDNLPLQSQPQPKEEVKTFDDEIPWGQQ